MTVFAAMGVIITSAAIVIYPGAGIGELWDPVKLVGRFTSPVVIAISMFTVVVATLSVNIAANVVSPANDFAKLLRKNLASSALPLVAEGNATPRQMPQPSHLPALADRSLNKKITSI